MKKIFTIISLCFFQSLFSQETNSGARYSEVNEQIKPSLFSNLGESCSTPEYCGTFCSILGDDGAGQ